MKPALGIATAAVMVVGMVFAQTAPQSAQPGAYAAARPFAARARASQYWAYQRVMNQLNLAEAQKEQAKSIFQTAWQNSKPVREQLRQNRQAMADAVKANNSTQIRQLAATQGALNGQLAASRAEARAQFYQVLTPDQRAKLDTLEENMRARMQQRVQWMQQRQKKSDQ